MMDQQTRTDQRATGAGWYLYGVIRADATARLRKEDLGEESLLPVRHGAVCALGSDAPLADSRKELMRHADVVQRVFERITILPARYGVVLPAADRVVDTLLGPYQDRLVAQLARLQGMTQVTVTGTHQEEPALARVLERHPILAGQRHEATRSYDAAVRLGQRIAAELARIRDEDAGTVLDALRRHAQDDRPSAALHEHMFLHTAFPVRTTAIRAFDDAVGDLRRRLPHATIRAVGPQAPYAFVELDTEGQPAWA